LANILTFTKNIKAPLGHVYHALATTSGWLEWFAHYGSGKVGENLTLHILSKDSMNSLLHFTKLEENKSVAFTYIDMNTYQMAGVQITLSGEDGNVNVRMEVSDYEEALKDGLTELWEGSLDNLKSVIETGKDLTLWNRPFLGILVEGWVTPELKAKKGLTAEFGILLNGVFEGSGAQKVGMQKGNVLVKLDDIEIKDHHVFQEVMDRYKAGDTIPAEYYAGSEVKHAAILLSQYPLPEPPATAQDTAEKMRVVFESANAKIAKILEGQSEAQLEYRPAGGEWSAKEIIAHLIANFTDSYTWLGTFIAGQPVFPYTANLPTRIKTILALYPSMDELLAAFRQKQEELLAYLGEIPADVTSRKSSMARLAYRLSNDYSYHFLNHIDQLKDTLAQAVDVRSS
jgi:uncharacterized protein YndB with AHSA1/START domain